MAGYTLLTMTSSAIRQHHDQRKQAVGQPSAFGEKRCPNLSHIRANSRTVPLCNHPKSSNFHAVDRGTALPPGGTLYTRRA